MEGARRLMLILHANWSDNALHLWAESVEQWHRTEASPPPADGDRAEVVDHPFVLDAAALHEIVQAFAPVPSPVSVPVSIPGAGVDASSLTLRLPARSGRPVPSDGLLRIIGGEAGALGGSLESWRVPTMRIEAGCALEWLLSLNEPRRTGEVEFGAGVRVLRALATLIASLLADQRFVPTLLQTREGRYLAYWQPWLHDEATRERLDALLTSAPGVLRAAVNEFDHQLWPTIEDALRGMTDPIVRRWLRERDFQEAVEDTEGVEDEHLLWLRGLLTDANELSLTDRSAAAELLSGVRSWIARLDDAEVERPFRLMLRVEEPLAGPDLPELQPVKETVEWRLSFFLRSTRIKAQPISASVIWEGGESAFDQTLSGARAQELLLTELGRAARIYPALQDVLEQPHPTALELSTLRVHEFLREHAPVLREAGIEIETPHWWRHPKHRVGMRLSIDSDSFGDEAGDGRDGLGRTGRALGLDALVKFEWQLAIGDRVISLDTLKRLSMSKSSLVPMDGAWVEIDPQTLGAARKFLENGSQGEMTVLEALRTAYGFTDHAPALPVFGIDATGWVSDFFNGGQGEFRAVAVEQPSSLDGQLRPYQKRGLSWLAFLDRLGLGACLADDMGLGKTIQLIALLLHERERLNGSEAIGPTLVVAPMSVVGNWVNELARFAPDITVHVHHGLDRTTGEAFITEANRHDIVITTYGLVTRDIEFLGRVDWRRVVLDEAQFIKNPPTKQSKAIRSLTTDRRIALTGTPVENRLGELWSILEFCNPGYLGTSGEFRRRFVLPIERRRDESAAVALRALIRPFVLRRVKTDPEVVPDLPDLVQTKDYAILTSEQARLYQSVVDGMLRAVDESEGTQRRGHVLAGLIKLKQVCNHPMNLAGSDDEPAAIGASGPPQSARSGKTMRLMEMLEEVVAAGDKALIFTQFRRMGHLLNAMIAHDLDTQTLFLHGGTPRTKRDELIARFQSDDRAAPIFILSLRAGGVGLNLTAANHVFHFDRWWNPAVESQATDRAFRIGQKRTVHVHKLISRGTLEERIDEMLEQKTELAERIVGAGETWLTELSSNQLRELLSLRQTVMEVEA